MNEPRKEQHEPVRCRYPGDGIFIKDKFKLVKIDYDNLARVEATGNYSYFCCKDGKKFLVPYRIGIVELYLPQERFLRVHRSHIINAGDIKLINGNKICTPTGISPSAGNDGISSPGNSTSSTTPGQPTRNLHASPPPRTDRGKNNTAANPNGWNLQRLYFRYRQSRAPGYLHHGYTQ